MESKTLLVVLALVALVAVVSLSLFTLNQFSGAVTLASGCKHRCDKNTLVIKCPDQQLVLDCKNGCDLGSRKCK
ncbi:MAG: hypothetical protein AABX52_01190 [Nanoarchaeota archaeon]